MEMTQAKIDEFLAAPRHAIAATSAADGAPQLTPIWFVYEGGVLYFTTGRRSVKARNLARDDRISLCVDGGHPDARAVVVYGRAEVGEMGTAFAADVRWRILRRYHNSDAEARRYADSMADRDSVLVKVTPRRVVTMDFN